MGWDGWRGRLRTIAVDHGAPASCRAAAKAVPQIHRHTDGCVSSPSRSITLIGLKKLQTIYEEGVSMSLGDYLKGPEYKANAARLGAELQAYRQQSQSDIQALQAKYDDLEAKAR